VIAVMLWTDRRRRKTDRHDMLSTHLIERCMIYTTGPNVTVKTKVLDNNINNKRDATMTI